jgi:hypothetical protein
MTSRRALASCVALLALASITGVPARGSATDGRGHDVVITAAAVHPPELAVLLHERVTFVNRSGAPVHVEFVGPHGEHEVFQVPGQIWAEFHFPGDHPYVVHLGPRGAREVTGIVRVHNDPAAAPRECVGLTVEEVCIER